VPMKSDLAAPLRANRTEVQARILVAEDRATNAEVAMAQLHKLGYQAGLARNGAEAVKAAQQGGYDLVLMDCEMPEMDGFEATRCIRESVDRRIPIIALTANAMQGDRQRALDAGMNDHLAKPVDLQNLADVLAKWLTGQGGNDSETNSAAPSAEEAVAIFDEEAFLKRLMGDRQLAGVVLRAFLDDIPSQLKQLGARLGHADAPGASSQIHALKGAAATVGAASLSAAAMNMLVAGKAGHLDRCLRLLPGIEEEFERFKNTVRLAGLA